MAVVAARTATNVNYEALASEVGVSAPTAKQWLSILVSSGIVALIQPYSNNALKRVIKALRMYFLDTGLCAHLTRWTSAETLERGAMDGAFFETWGYLRSTRATSIRENLSRRCISTVTATRRRSTLSFIRMVSFRR